MKDRNIKNEFTILVLADLAIVFISSYIGIFFFSSIPASAIQFIYPQQFYLAFVVLITFYFFDLYYVVKSFRRYLQLVNLVAACSIAFLFLCLITFFDQHLILGRKFLLVSFSLIFLLSFVVRVFFSFLTQRYFVRNVLLVGSSKVARLLVEEFSSINNQNRIRSSGINIAGYVCDEENDFLEKKIPHLGKLAEIEKVVKKSNISLIVYALEKRGAERCNEILVREKLKGRYLISAIALYEAITGRAPYEHIDSSWLIEDCLRGNKFTDVRIKRVIDLLFGTLLSIITFPIVLFVAFLIKVESRGSAFFIQDRVGQNGKLFKIYKLRTMEDINLREIPHGAEGWHEKNIQRVTRLGKFLRKTRIDELPQFWNVLRGNMSIVGPRPEMEIFISQCETKIPFYRLRLAVKPGITGWAQIWHSHTSTLKGYKKKFEYDLYYLSHLSLRLDLEIMLRTIFFVFSGKGK